jgi:hypothetical protein
VLDPLDPRAERAERHVVFGLAADGARMAPDARVVGSLVNRDGSIARRVMVRCIPADYIPGLSSDSLIKLNYTNDSGVYIFNSLHSGAYVITALDTARLTRCLIQGTFVDHDTVAAKSGILDVPGAVKVAIPDSVNFPTGFFYVPGTTIAVSLTKAAKDGYVILDSVPSGQISSIKFLSDTQHKIIRSDITVPVAGTAVINNIMWNFTKKILLNTSPTGANVSGTVTNFPILVRLTKGSFNFADAKSDGSDIKFTKADDSILPHEFERWDQVDGLAEIWVKVDTVFGNDSTHYLTMYYGNANAVAPSLQTQVFDTANGFFGNYHFNNNLKDATLNNFDGTNVGSTSTTNGIIGHGRQFDGVSNYVNLGDLPDRPAGTISFWFRPEQAINTSTVKTQGIWGKKADNNINFSVSLLGKDFFCDSYTTTEQAGNLISKMEIYDTAYYLVCATNRFFPDIWHYATWCWGNNSEQFYVDGILEGSITYSYPVIGTGNDEIGRSNYDSLANITDGKPRYFYGSLDEFRIDNKTRSIAWIKLCYMNQRKDDKLVVFK